MLDNSHPSLELPTLLDSQAELLTALIELAQQQIAAIEHGRMNELLSVLGRKQRLLDGLTTNALRLRPLHDQLQTSEVLTEQQRCACRGKHALATTRFDELFELEKRCEDLLSESREQIAKRLQQTVHSINVADAYRQESIPDSQGGRLDLSSSG